MLLGLKRVLRQVKQVPQEKKVLPPRSPSVVPDVHVRQLRPHALLQLQNHVELSQAREHTQIQRLAEVCFMAWHDVLLCVGSKARPWAAHAGRIDRAQRSS